jgi:hypothetical protein
MIHFIVATLHFYRTDIKVVRGEQTVEQFKTNNEDVVKRVYDEAVSLFSYELSSAQMDCGIKAYIMKGTSVKNTLVATLYNLDCQPKKSGKKKTDIFSISSPGHTGAYKKERRIGISRSYRGSTKDLTLKDLVDFLIGKGVDLSIVDVSGTTITSKV